MIHGISSRIKPANDNVEKYFPIPNCLNMASTSYKNCFQYTGVPLTEPINGNELSPAKNRNFFFQTTFHCS